MSVRPDNRLSDAPMTPVTCQPCGAKVLVRKSSWEQTSVQWDAGALAQCRERSQPMAHPDAVTPRPGLFLVCARLRASIEAAARTGAVPVLDEPR